MAEQDVDATTPLLSHSQPDVRCHHAVSTRNGFYKFITIEPALLLYLFFKTGLGPLQEQYVYLRIGQNMNMTLPNSTATTCTANENSTDYVKQQNIQSETSLWMIYCTVCSVVPALIATVFIGGYTDKGGRKTGLILPIMGGILQLYLLFCIEIFHLPIWFILIASLVEGLSGGTAMFLMASFSYISDITNYRQRSLRIIVLEVVIGFSSTASFILSGYMIQATGFLGTTLGLHMIVVLNLCVAFQLPETCSVSANAKLCTLEHFRNSFHVFGRNDHSGKRRWALLTSMFVLFFIAPARLGTESVQILFMLDTPLCWNSALIGYFKGLYYLASSTGSILLTKLAQPRLNDLQLVVIGCTSAVAHLMFWAFVKTNWMMYLVPLLGVFCAVPVGMLRAFTSKIVLPQELGALFSWIAAMEQIGVIIGGVCFTAIYQATMVWFNGFIFIVIATFYFCGGTIAVLLFIKMRTSTD